jgi:hypothetical protein
LKIRSVRTQVPGCHVSRLLNCTVARTFYNVARCGVSSEW